MELLIYYIVLTDSAHLRQEVLVVDKVLLRDDPRVLDLDAAVVLTDLLDRAADAISAAARLLRTGERERRCSAEAGAVFTD